jgi:trimeric autotransporter adhesin
MKKSVFFLLLLFAGAQLHCQTWNPVGFCIPPGDNVTNMRVYKNKLYMSLGMMNCGNQQDDRFVAFDGQYFDSVPGTVWGTVEDLNVYADSLVVGGIFTYAGTDNFPDTNFTHNLAYWDGNAWQDAIWSIDAIIRSVAVYNGELYIGGDFTQINTQPFQRIARWNGSQWTDVGGGFLGNCSVECMEVFNGELYVGGLLSLPGFSNSYYRCVRWNGTQWDSVGGKFGPNRVTSMCADTANNKLYIGGGLTYAGTTPVWSVACWDGSNLTSPGGGGITNGAIAMRMYNNELYVGGTGFNDTTIAKFDGISWTAISHYPSYGTALSFEIYNGNLYVGGIFDSIAGIAAQNIACYGNNCPQGVGMDDSKKELSFALFPNPAKNELNILVQDRGETTHIVKLFSFTGAKIIEERFSKQLTLNTSFLAKGIYQVQVCNKNGDICHSEKVVIQ